MTVPVTTATLLILPSRPLMLASRASGGNDAVPGGDDAAAVDVAAVDAIAEAAGLSPLDVRIKVATGRAGVLLRSRETDRLNQVAGHLRTLGHSAVVITDDEVRDLPAPVAARGITPDGPLGFVNGSGQVIATIPKGMPILVAVTHLDRAQPTRLPMNPGLVAAPDPAAIAADAAAELRWLTESDRQGLVIDVAWNGGRDRVRLRGEKLVFTTPGHATHPSAAINTRAILARLLGAEHQSTLDLEFEQFQPPRIVASGMGRGRTVEPSVVPLDRITGDRDGAWDSYVRFLVTAWNAELFRHAGAVISWEGTHPRLTRAAASGAAPGLDAARTPREERAVLVAGPVAERSMVQEARNRLPIIGPTGVVGTLLLATLGAAAGSVLADHARPWPELVAAGVGLLGLTHALTLFDRRRRVENFPTSRIRSAAVGACEIQGYARAALPLRTPYSQMPCVWYEFRVVRRETGSDAKERVHIVTGHSNDHPFYIEDETGRLEVDPTGAQVEVSTVQKLSQVPFSGAPLPPGTRVEITERYIPVDQPIWVIGHLQVMGDAAAGEESRMERLRVLKADPLRMAAGDANGDGIVDGEEWQSMVEEARGEWELSRLTGTGRTDRLVLGRSPRDGFFYITERSEKVVVRRFLWRAVFWLATGAGLLTWALLSFRAAGTGE